MDVSIIEQTETFEIRLFEFRDIYGRHITAFYQLVRKPHLILGGYNSFDQAIQVMEAVSRSDSNYATH